VLWPSYRASYVSQHSQLRTGWFCWGQSFSAHVPIADMLDRETMLVCFDGVTNIRLRLRWHNSASFPIWDRKWLLAKRKWPGRSGITVAMYHRFCGMSICGLNGPCSCKDYGLLTFTSIVNKSDVKMCCMVSWWTGVESWMCGEIDGGW